MSSVALIFGAGKNVGAGVAKAFAAKGYKIATVSRSASQESNADDRLHVLWGVLHRPPEARQPERCRLQRFVYQ